MYNSALLTRSFIAIGSLFFLLFLAPLGYTQNQQQKIKGTSQLSKDKNTGTSTKSSSTSNTKEESVKKDEIRQAAKAKEKEKAEKHKNLSRLTSVQVPRGHPKDI